MDAARYRELTHFDKTLVVGQAVTVYYEQSGRLFSGLAVVTTLSDTEVTVRLTEDILLDHHIMWPKGTIRTVLRFKDGQARWTEYVAPPGR